ncbi:hypothetical protein PGT21_009967 [Puccinia graminis f. sp. tritici]|uniref:Uncharacterized protein n=1 Tax=Puccinia graminis f. sp. tritici TaxID=56615 RepID=A0A5B0QN11_PUCGR|nr:hypothetical protein PGT21_009967 [Puccinia graminis f. sp. tritici]
MPPKTGVVDPLLASMTPNTPTPTTRTMPITQPDLNPTDPNATPRASATEPAPSDEVVLKFRSGLVLNCHIM